MKKVFLLLSFLCFFGLLGMQTSFAAINLNVSPIKYELKAEPGEVITQTAELINSGDKSHFITMGASDFESRGNSGTPYFIRKSELVNPDQELSTWIDIDTENFTIEPGETKEVTFTITVPENPTPGGHYGAVIFKNTGSEQSSGAAVGINADYAVIILVEIDGEIIVDGGIKEVQITGGGYSKRGDFSRNTGEETPPSSQQDEEEDDFGVDIVIGFENNGNTHLKPTGKIILKDENGIPLKRVGKEVIINEADVIIGEKEVDYIPVNDQGGNVLPGQVRSFELEWEGFSYTTVEDGKEVVKFKDPETYFSDQALKEKSDDVISLYPWEKIETRTKKKTITADIDVNYTGIDGENIPLRSAKEFQIEYEEKVKVNIVGDFFRTCIESGTSAVFGEKYSPSYLKYVIYILLFLLFIFLGIIRFFIIAKRRKKKRTTRLKKIIAKEKTLIKTHKKK